MLWVNTENNEYGYLLSAMLKIFEKYSRIVE